MCCCRRLRYCLLPFPFDAQRGGMRRPFNTSFFFASCLDHSCVHRWIDYRRSRGYIGPLLSAIAMCLSRTQIERCEGDNQPAECINELTLAEHTIYVPRTLADRFRQVIEHRGLPPRMCMSINRKAVRRLYILPDRECRNVWRISAL